jgi:hypothetical protein
MTRRLIGMAATGTRSTRGYLQRHYIRSQRQVQRAMRHQAAARPVDFRVVAPAEAAVVEVVVAGSRLYKTSQQRRGVPDNNTCNGCKAIICRCPETGYSSH